MRYILLALFFYLTVPAFSQLPARDTSNPAYRWADSVYQSLSPDERIGQLVIARLSSIDLKTRKVTFYDSLLNEMVRQYNIGGICLFQGSPVIQAGMVNSLQAKAKTPIMISMDAEWGVGMRLLDSVIPLPKQMMLGAMGYDSLVYAYGRVVANQCRRMGIQLNYAPVVDVNNNPNNPVINDRSFGEDKYKVARYGIQYMKGMQDDSVMACAKHFPGHGDVSVDSHYDLPVINKTIVQLDSLELYPFRQMFKSGVGSVMIGHLFIPSIDNRPNRPSSISARNIRGLLRDSIGFNGLTITDALEMQGVKKFYPGGAASVESIIAGNDMLCLPEDIPQAIRSIREAAEAGRISWDDIAYHAKKILLAKYQYGLISVKPIDTQNLVADLNREIPGMRRLVAENAITLLSHQDGGFFPLKVNADGKDNIAYVGVGLQFDNSFASRMRREYNAGVFYFDYSVKDSAAIQYLIDSIVMNYRKVVIGIHNMGRSPATNFGISKQAISFVNALQQRARAMTFIFGNAYAVKNWCYAKNMAVCYEDDSIVHRTAIDLLQGKLSYKGTLPVSVCENYPYGSGVTHFAGNLPEVSPESLGFDPAKLARIDSIASDAIKRKATPGCMILVAKDGKIAYQKGFGYFTYEQEIPVTESSVYDLASITKIASTTIAVMKLVDEGKLSIDRTLGDYLPWTRGTDKAGITLRALLLHEAGLSAFIPFYRNTLDAGGTPLKNLYAPYSIDSFCVRVADDLFVREDWLDTMYHVMAKSPIGQPGRYLYSDNDFIFLGKVVEQVTGKPLNDYVHDVFYTPMGLDNIHYLPLHDVPRDRIVPTEYEKTFRRQLLRGNVHDPGAAMFGGVAGHAGLFSNAYDLACLMQMLLNGGKWNGVSYLKPETIHLFTAYGSDNSRRGLGFDKPEKDNTSRKEPYPAMGASPETFGHTGFTGTCVWADPAKNLVFVFLSNRVHPNGSSLLNQMNVRPKLLEAVYDALRKM